MKADTSEAEYCEGSIVRIKLENFLTYDAVEFKPGAHLNVIIGPNATGKSSIVCAICLGLGGKTQFLGRARDASEYIKHGQQRAYIEIELKNAKGENFIVGRAIARDNTSKWMVNRRNATMKTVEELVARLNIQIGNLCQFLPQEKVGEFAKMSPQEVLENTEKAAGDMEMWQRHQKLKNASNTGKDLDIQLGRIKDTLERETQLNARLEQEVKNYQQRQHHLAKIDMLEKKKPWAEYEEKRKQYTADKEKMETLKESIKKARQEQAPLKAKFDRASNNKKVVDDAFKQQTEECKLEARYAASKSKEIDKQTDEVIELDSEMDQIRTQEMRRQKKVQELRSQLETLQQEFLALKDEDVQPQLDANRVAQSKVNQEMSKLQDRMGTIAEDLRQTKRDVQLAQKELSALGDVNNKRLQLLRQKHKPTFDAVMWLRENKDKFKGVIHEPIMTLLNVNDQSMIKYIEASVSFNDMKAFVCEDPDDVQPFLTLVRDKQNLSVNAVQAPKEPVNSFKPAKNIEAYKNYGFSGYLREMVTCPPAVMRYLCRLHKFHAIPVGNDRTKNNVEMVIQNCPELHTFFTSHHKYVVRKSKYGNHKSSSCMEVRTPNLLTEVYDTVREEAMQVQLSQSQAKLTGLEKENGKVKGRASELEKMLNTLREEKKNLQERRGQRRTLQNRIDMKRQQVERQEGEAIDLTKEEDRINAKIMRITSKKCRLLKDQMEHTEKCLKASIQKVRLSIQQATLQKLCATIEDDMREQSQALQGLEREFEQIRDDVKKVKEQARRLLAVAKRATDTGDNEELSAELKKSFEALPSTLDEIEAAIHEERARMDCTMAADENVVVEYEKRKKDIAKWQEELLKCEASLMKHNTDMTQVREKWIDPLRQLISRINNNFSYFFQQLQCAGEVELFVPDQEDDYSKYGVTIKVKFRKSDDLQELKASYQSGGEKSVSTVLYMMALQELTSCPFRCVDEINQGMDPHNERRIFDTVKIACRKGTSQYFMLTPKLLPNLDYTEKMTVLCVFNGPHMADWNLKKFIKRRAKLNTGV